VNLFGANQQEGSWEKSGEYFLKVVEAVSQNEQISSFQAAFTILRSFCITTETDKQFKSTFYRTGRDVSSLNLIFILIF
jgi:hypothetical protein